MKLPKTLINSRTGQKILLALLFHPEKSKGMTRNEIYDFLYCHGVIMSYVSFAEAKVVLKKSGLISVHKVPKPSLSHNLKLNPKYFNTEKYKDPAMKEQIMEKLQILNSPAKYVFDRI